MIAWLRKLFILGIVFSVGVAQAQEMACPELVGQALALVKEACADLQRNQVCYGHDSLQADLVTEMGFDTVGDIVLLNNIQQLTLKPMDLENSLWGISMIKMQANLPDTLPGQNVTFVLFGEVNLEDANAESGAGETSGATSEFEDDLPAPMQAFYFTSGIGDAACNEAPQSGLLIQTPEGSGEVTFQANGVQIALGSTAFMQAERGSEMIVSVIEGQASLTAFDVTVTAKAGSQVRIELDDDGTAAAAPGQPQPYDLDDLAGLPLILLEREIDVAPPLDTTVPPPPTRIPQATAVPPPATQIPQATAVPPTATSVPQDSQPPASGGTLQVSANGGSALSGCSEGSDESYTIVIDNQSDRGVSFYWVDYSCGLVLYHTIEPGTTKRQGTFTTHPWVLTDTETGETIFGPWGSNSAGDFTITVTN